jgi:hypothetical protein
MLLPSEFNFEDFPLFESKVISLIAIDPEIGHLIRLIVGTIILAVKIHTRIPDDMGLITNIEKIPSKRNATPKQKPINSLLHHPKLLIIAQ